MQPNTGKAEELHQLKSIYKMIQLVNIAAYCAYFDLQKNLNCNKKVLLIV